MRQCVLWLFSFEFLEGLFCELDEELGVGALEVGVRAVVHEFLDQLGVFAGDRETNLHLVGYGFYSFGLRRGRKTFGQYVLCLSFRSTR